MSANDNLSTKTLLRQAINPRRQALSSKEQLIASRSLVKQARTYNRLLIAKRVLSYRPIRGEISPIHLEALLQTHIFLPKITHYRNRSMQFLPKGLLVPDNRFNILQPILLNRALPGNFFDAALMPLTAFDREGNRLGMGGGFYDRAFSQRNRLKRPLLIGLAHHFQEVNSIPKEPWDMSLDAIITDHELIVF